jgi:predicted lysophospholipase L1 biosynthesis ABC-type transport system permease subunit
VVSVNEALARQRFPGVNPIGRRIWISETAREVVGVVSDVRSQIGFQAPPSAFLPLAQTPAVATRLFEGWFPTHALVRSTGDSAGLARAIEHAVREAAPRVPAGPVRSMQQVLSLSVRNERFQMLLMTLFAGLAVVLASVGLYGVISRVTAERTHEIGVRMALGARSADILRMVMRQAMKLVLAGLALGTGAALAATRVLERMLYGVSTRDPQSFLAVAVLLSAVALLACYVPARRATRVDPMVALRDE